MSNIGTRESAVALKPESYLNNFGIEPLRDSSFLCPAKYLVRVISPKSNCETFDGLRCETYKTKQKALKKPPPTSGTIALCAYAEMFWIASVKH